MSMIQYKCPSCGAKMSFDPSKQVVKCEYCGSEFQTEAIKVMMQSEGKIDNSKEFNWNEYNTTLDLNEKMDTKVYVCESCGAVIESNPETGATMCPYCDNNVVLSDKFSSGLKPNGIIPFKISKREVPKIIERYYKDKIFLPDNFFSQSVLEKVQGVYVPFWLFSGQVHGEMVANSHTVRNYRSGSYDVTETDYYVHERVGDIRFRHVPVDASVRMDNDLMDSVGPFDFSKMEAFEPSYLAGFVADRFDTSPDAELSRARLRMTNTTKRTFDNSVRNVVDKYRHRSFDLVGASLIYALLPVYVVNCHYMGKRYRYAINGQSGKMVGELPSSSKKKVKHFFKHFGKSFITGLIVALVFCAIMFISEM